jgi:hypothetical protein
MRTRYRTNGDWERFASPLGIIRLILLVDWDPIGILGHTGAMDEYDSYAVGIYDLLSSDASQQDLVSHLRQIEKERMGVRGNPNMPLSAVAAKLKAAFDTARADAEE